MTRFVLLFHVLSALVFFTALGVELVTLASMRRAETGDELRRALVGFDINTRIGPLALTTIVGTGIVLAWSWRSILPAWIVGSFAALIVNGVIAGVTTGRFVIGLRRELQVGPLDQALAVRIRTDLTTSFVARAAIVLGIAAAMVLRPEPLVVALILVGGPILAIASMRAVH